METIIGIFTIIGGLIGSFITYVVFKLERKDKFRMVAIEKRLEAHQKAFSMWYKLIWVIHSPITERTKVISEARDFWITNCLYLEKNTRKEFDVVINLVDGYSDKLRYSKETSDPKLKENIRRDFMKDWERIFDLPKFIQSEVELEPIVIDLKITPENK